MSGPSTASPQPVVWVTGTTASTLSHSSSSPERSMLDAMRRHTVAEQFTVDATAMTLRVATLPSGRRMPRKVPDTSWGRPSAQASGSAPGAGWAVWSPKARLWVWTCSPAAMSAVA